MKRVIFLSSLLIFLGSCNQNSQNTSNKVNDKPQVVSTSTIIANLTEEIGGEEIDNISILQAGADPHIYEPVPQDTIALEKADLILYNGYNLEPNIIKLINSTGIKGEKLAVGEQIKPLDFEHKGQKRPDPHVWGNAQNGIIMVKAIRDKLIEIDPENQGKFTENAAKLIEELQELDSWIKVQIATIPPNQRKLITSHDAFQYYSNAYGLEIPGTLIGISTEEQPSAQTIKNLVEIIRNSGVKAIFAETTINPTLIETVAQESKVKVAQDKLYSDSISVKGTEADSYVKMLKVNTRTIVNALADNSDQPQ
ncbi:MAG: zinc ABC transporter solute-binding protein [Cyanobacteria bacterium]|nr:zinc ABC transporter solute-binding protein [Cyanobacteria bacterium CG_2015-16_32_12]NCO77892.1 zinc ABC transporter solute-binding protein [Cyanobacteria bacterium CG_2015-22_32_23]NCQ03045.1 zinc ABC transporter solute-binding protein [Cyanobacteria bacterium CG_2015-09_32_10]NCQ41990.1 zinc ABC transporter solute-binding protein [Cyanobacteria bacterium CG_2015-04_32_10]NCS85559.1 zinc ABC transporter solute-binding protein [Cyanobacteria bacterium CG_2015-02_32_10]